MDYVLQTFGGIPLSTALVFIAAIVFIITLMARTYKLIIKYHDDLQKKEQIFEELKDDMKEIKEVQNKMITKEEFLHLREKQDNLEQKINEIIVSQKNIEDKQAAFEAESRDHNLNKLRDRLVQIYRYYADDEKNPMLAWSEMEKEAYDKLFKDYDKLGGNGFIHSTVEPAMASLEVIKMNDQENMVKLMKTRRG